MILDSIHHIAIITNNLETTKDFYINKLGFKLIKETIRPDKNDIVLNLSVNNDTELEVFVREDAPLRLSDPEALGLRHLAFKVKDIESYKKELESKGIISEDIRVDVITNKKHLFFQDPDGLPIELHE